MKKIIFTVLLFVLSACGGGSGGPSNSGILVEGLLTQGESTEHSRSITNLRHSAGQNIGEVEICALGECSVTDDSGQYGFLAPAEFQGGEVLFSIKGHGIDTDKTVNIPESADEVFIHFEHADNQVIVHHMLVNGQDFEQPADLDGHSDHSDSADHHQAQSEGVHGHE